jgi:hypothetical protein
MKLKPILFVSSLALTGCGGYVGVATPTGAYVDAPPVDVEVYPRYEYRGGYIYNVHGHYYHHYRGRWVHYHRRPW